MTYVCNNCGQITGDPIDPGGLGWCITCAAPQLLDFADSGGRTLADLTAWETDMLIRQMRERLEPGAGRFKAGPPVLRHGWAKIVKRDEI